MTAVSNNRNHKANTAMALEYSLPSRGARVYLVSSPAVPSGSLRGAVRQEAGLNESSEGPDLPGKPVAYNYELLSMTYCLLEGAVARDSGKLHVHYLKHVSRACSGLFGAPGLWRK